MPAIRPLHAAPAKQCPQRLGRYQPRADQVYTRRLRRWNLCVSPNPAVALIRFRKETGATRKANGVESKLVVDRSERFAPVLSQVSRRLF
jgi:hypothetical protein